MIVNLLSQTCAVNIVRRAELTRKLIRTCCFVQNGETVDLTQSKAQLVGADSGDIEDGKEGKGKGGKKSKKGEAVKFGWITGVLVNDARSLAHKKGTR